MKSKYHIILYISVLLKIGSISAQDIVVPEGNKKRTDFMDKVFTGGNFYLSFGTITSVEISPLVGYHLTDRLSVGTGISYMYFKHISWKNGLNVYGGRVFSSFYLLKWLFLYAENEVLSIGLSESKENVPRILVDNPLVGGGISQQFGNNSALNLMLLYNLNDSQDNFYPSKWIFRMGVNIGL